MSISRTLSPYEKTQLAKYGLSLASGAQLGEKPIEYVTGHVDFCGLDFLIDQRALIPRVETEELVALILKTLKLNYRAGSNPTIVDVGTGCGAMAISLAAQLKERDLRANIYGLEISAEALQLAEINEKRLLGSESIITWIKSDLLSKLPRKIEPDLIVANLPYIPAERIEYLEPSVKDFEPHLALDGGSDGFRIVENLLGQLEIRQFKGELFLEIDYTHDQQFLNSIARNWQIETWISQLSLCRFARAKIKSDNN